mgnify:CR=1 FL=1
MVENIIKSQEDLEELFRELPCNQQIENDSYRKTRFVNNVVFDNLIKYKLDYEPYISIAKRCSMTHIDIMRSQKTNRFYIGFLNTGGHGARYEIRPVKKVDIMDFGYIEDMFANFGQKMDWGIELNENYEI